MEKQFKYNDKVTYNGEQHRFVMYNGDGTATLTSVISQSEVIASVYDIEKHSFNLVDKIGMKNIIVILMIVFVTLFTLFMLAINNSNEPQQVQETQQTEYVNVQQEYNHIFDIKLIYKDGTIDTIVITYDGVHKEGIYLSQKINDGESCVMLNSPKGEAVVACGIRRYKELKHKIN